MATSTSAPPAARSLTSAGRTGRPRPGPHRPAPHRPASHRVAPTAGRGPTDTLTVHDVLWQDPAGAVLRAAMAAEIRGRYADRLGDRTRQPSIVATVDPDTVAYTGVAYRDDEPVGHLALRRHRRDVEITRMYVVPECRGRGVASALLRAAEDAAGRLGARRIVVQTGDRQPDAVRCLRRHGFAEVPVFAPYRAMAYSQCFARAVDVAG